MLCPDGFICKDDVKITRDDHGAMVMIADVPGTYWGFVWHGGNYIDVIRQSSTGTYSVEGVTYCYGEQNICVWNYETGTREIAWMDKEAFVSTLNNWMEGMNG